MRSSPGEGTTFDVYWPRAAKEPVKLAEVPARRNEPGRRQRIVLVDDEPFIVSSTRRLLEKLGHDVLAFTSSGEALAALKDGTRGVDLVLTDQTMPGGTGLELATAVRETRPTTPVVLMTGFSAQLTPDRLRAAGVSAVLAKPFTATELSRVVDEALRG